MVHPVSFFQIQGSDSRALIKFYQNTFGWKGTPAPDGGMLVAAEPGGIPGALGPSSDGSAHLALYITVDDVKTHLTRAKRAGARVAMAETRLPGDLGTIGGIIDPAGNWVGLWAAPSPRPSSTPPRRKKAARRAATPKKAKAPPRRSARRKV